MASTSAWLASCSRTSSGANSRKVKLQEPLLFAADRERKICRDFRREAGGLKQSGQTRPQPEVAAVAFAERDVQLVKAADEIGRRVANPAGEIHLFASDAAPRPHQAAHGFEGLARICQVHQHEPGIGEVERPFGEPRRVRVAHAKLDVRQTARFGLLSRLLDLRGTIIDSDNRTARPDFVGEPAGDIAAAAPDLDDAEAFPQARPTQKRSGY